MGSTAEIEVASRLVRRKQFVLRGTARTHVDDAAHRVARGRDHLGEAGVQLPAEGALLR